MLILIHAVVNYKICVFSFVFTSGWWLHTACTKSPIYSFSFQARYMFLDLRSVARFRICVLTFRVEYSNLDFHLFPNL